MENEELLNALLDELRALNQTQKDISQALQVLARSEVEKRLSHIFDNPEEILVFQLSDGEKPTSELAGHIGASKMKISRLWQKWEEEFGIVESMGSKKPYRANYSLEELALLVGKPPENSDKQIEEKE